jgi:hypothetical protein
MELAKRGIHEQQWKGFCSFASTENTLGVIAERVAKNAPDAIVALSADEQEQALKDAQDFIVELCEKADETGVEIELEYYIQLLHQKG